MTLIDKIHHVATQRRKAHADAKPEKVEQLDSRLAMLEKKRESERVGCLCGANQQLNGTEGRCWKCGYGT